VNEARPSFRTSLRALPGPAWILFGGSFVNRFGSFVITFLALYLTSKGYSAAQAGLALGAYGVGSLASAAVGGYLADRLGRRAVIAVSMFSAAATMLALSQADALALIILLTGVAGFTSELYRPASSALLADLVPAGQRLAAFAAYRLAINAGFAFGPAVAGLLAERSFVLLFVGDALTSAAFGVIALIALPEGTRSRRSEESRGEAARAVLGDRAFMAFLAASLVVAFVYVQSGSSFALHVRDNGLSRAVFGGLISLNGIVIVLIELPITSLTRRFQPTRVIAMGCLLTGLGFGLTSLAHSSLALAGTVLVWTLGEIIAAPVSAAYVADLAPPHLRGRYQGIWDLTFGLALILAPALGMAIYDRSPGVLWGACVVLGCVAAFLVARRPARRVAPDLSAPEPGPELPGVET
jgi:MFS family permease